MGLGWVSECGVWVFECAGEWCFVLGGRAIHFGNLFPEMEIANLIEKLRLLENLSELFRTL